jgi:hyperosmotically inducible protein
VKLFLVLLTFFILGSALVIAADPISDDSIYDAVRMRLANDPDVKGGGTIEVKVTQGSVELSGTVRTDKARTKAEKLAKKVKGVKKVVNQLKVAEARL